MAQGEFPSLLKDAHIIHIYIITISESSSDSNQGCTTFLLLPTTLHLFLQVTAASEFKIFYFCIASVLLPHTKPSLLPRLVCLGIFLLTILIHSRQSFYINSWLL